MTEHETAIRASLEDVFGFEITTFVRTAKQVTELATAKPFGAIVWPASTSGTQMSSHA